ncbi:MAG: signal recognition particle protein [Desulfovibrionaceae bacterium]|nr:signal recognition particle protein [Desulfovibrionaceae bacterium]
MFDNLSDRLSQTFRNLTGRGQLTEENIQSGLKEVRLALLEADVNFAVVKSFVENVRTKCVGQNIVKGVNPAQQVVKIVYDELVRVLGGETSELSLAGAQPASILLVGLQGSGKTTSAGKLANFLRKKKMRPYLVPLDVYRPAAIDQLVTLAKQLNIPYFPSTTSMTPHEIAESALSKAKEEGATVLLLDTAGRLHVDEPLMDELKDLKDLLHPQEILFVADAMTGQEAVTVAQTFHEKLSLTGVILTKMDGDARGGAALSIRSVTGAPVKFVGMGEKLSELEIFHPDRIAGRILGMGDVLTLVERAQAEFDEEEVKKLADKMKKASYNFNDFLAHLRQIKKLGSFESILKLVPGFGSLKEKLHEAANMVPDKEMAKMESIIQSMTKQEREMPEILNGSRRARIAKGSGVSIQKVNDMLRSFEQMRKAMKTFMKKSPDLSKINPKMAGAGGLGNLGNFGNLGGFDNYAGMAQAFQNPAMPFRGLGQSKESSHSAAEKNRRKKKDKQRRRKR